MKAKGPPWAPLNTHSAWYTCTYKHTGKITYTNTSCKANKDSRQRQAHSLALFFHPPNLHPQTHAHEHIWKCAHAHIHTPLQTPHWGISPSDCICPPGYERAILTCVAETAVWYSSNRSPARLRLSQDLREGSSQMWMHLITSLIHTPITPK